MRIQVHRDSNTAVEKVSNTTTHVALLNFKGQKHRANTCIVGATLVVALAAVRPSLMLMPIGATLRVALAPVSGGW